MQNSLENAVAAPPRRSQHPGFAVATTSTVVPSPTPTTGSPIIPGVARKASVSSAAEKREAEAEALSKVQVMAASLSELRNLLRKRLKKHAVRIPTLATLLVTWGILPNAMHETRALEELARSANLTENGNGSKERPGIAVNGARLSSKTQQRGSDGENDAGGEPRPTATSTKANSWANAMFGFSDVVQLISLVRRWKRAQREEVIAEILPRNWEYLTFRGVLYVLQKAHLEPKSQAEQLAMTRILDEEWPTESNVYLQSKSKTAMGARHNALRIHLLTSLKAVLRGQPASTMEGAMTISFTSGSSSSRASQTDLRKGGS